MPDAFAASGHPQFQEAVSHHSLCFGCGLANLFGLQAEVAREGSGSVSGRFFVKQDHQGVSRRLHEGLLAAAVQEVMALAVHSEGCHAATRRLELHIDQSASVGCFVRLRARVSERAGGQLRVDATADVDGENESDMRTIASANGLFVELDSVD